MATTRRGWTGLVVRAVAACCIAGSATGAAVIAVAVGVALRRAVEIGVPLVAIAVAAAGAAALAVLALLWRWSVEMARGSARAARRAFALLLYAGAAPLGVVQAGGSPLLLLGVAAALGLALLVRGAVALLPEPVPDPDAVPGPGDPLRPVPDGDVEAAAARRPYPYPFPLAPEVKRAHVEAVVAWQKEVISGTWLALSGIMLAVVAMIPEFWAAAELLATVVFLVGLLLAGLGVRDAVAPMRAKYRHIALLRAYGVRLDADGREVPFPRSGARTG